MYHFFDLAQLHNLTPLGILKVCVANKIPFFCEGEISKIRIHRIADLSPKSNNIKSPIEYFSNEDQLLINNLKDIGKCPKLS